MFTHYSENSEFLTTTNQVMLFKEIIPDYCKSYQYTVGRDSSVGIATRYGLDVPGIESRWGVFFHTHLDRPRGPPSLLYNGYRVFRGVKIPERGVEHLPHLELRLKEEYSYMSIPRMGLCGPF